MRRANDQIAIFYLVGLPLAAVAHGVLMLSFLAFRQPTQPLLNPDNVMQVAMVTLHRDANVLPEKVMVAPPVVTGDLGRRDDTPVVADQMVLETPDAEDKLGEDKVPENDEARKQRREDRIAVADVFDAPPGPETHVPTDPNSTVTSLADVYASGSGTNTADPELSQYVRDCKERIMQKWHVMPSVAAANPDLTVVIGVRIDDNGKIEQTKIVEGSGNRQYDSATFRAVRQMGSLPAPPSTKIMEYAEDGVFIRFRASDKVF